MQFTYCIAGNFSWIACFCHTKGCHAPKFCKENIKNLPQNHKICKIILPSKVSTIYGIWWCNRACMWHYFLSLFPYIGWCLWEDLLVVWVLGKYVVARLFTVWDIMITHWMSVVSSTLWCLYTLLRSLQRSWEDASYLSIPLDWPQDYWYIQLLFFHATNMKKISTEISNLA